MARLNLWTGVELEMQNRWSTARLAVASSALEHRMPAVLALQ
jgi:hypothetical protein